MPTGHVTSKIYGLTGRDVTKICILLRPIFDVCQLSDGELFKLADVAELFGATSRDLLMKF